MQYLEGRLLFPGLSVYIFGEIVGFHASRLPVLTGLDDSLGLSDTQSDLQRREWTPDCLLNMLLPNGRCSMKKLTNGRIMSPPGMA